MSLFAQLVSQIAQDNSMVLVTYGPLGIITAWFMWRAERVFIEIRALAHRIDGLTKALLVDMANRETTGVQTKIYARDAIAKIDARSVKEGDDSV